MPHFADSKSAIEFPIVRDMDTNMYERQDGSGLEVGSYAHRPILHDPDEIPSIEESALTPTELPFTQDDFVQQMEHALELVPEILGDESVGIKYAINGLLSLTPDGLPILGETSEVRGLWSAAAVWVKEGPGVGRALAEWMVEGEPEIDLQASDIARFYEHQKTAEHVKSRAAEGFNKTYGIVHPGEQWESARPVRLSPFYEREEALGAVFYEAAGWERPHWYESNKPLLEEFADQISRARGRVGLALVVADHQRRAPGDARPRGDVRPDRVLRLRHRRPRRARVRAEGLDAPDGREARQGRLHAGAHAARRLPLGPHGDAAGRRALPRGHRRRARHGRPQVVPRPPPRGRHRADLRPHLELDDARALGPAGARHPRRAVTGDDVSHEGFPFATCRTIEMGPLRVLASRISYVGDLGWELYVPIEQGARLWDMVWEAGEPHGIVPAGIGVYGTTGRLEKCYRAFGFELDGEYNVVEAGMAWGKVKDQDFVGKEAHVRHREEDPATVMCTLTVDDHTSAGGVKRYMLGGEPIVTRDGDPLVDSHGRRSYVTSAGAGPSVGKHILLSYLPPEYANVGQELAVEYMTERYPVTVSCADSTPLFDPDNERVKATGRAASRFPHEDPRLRQARAAHRRQDGPDRRRAGARDAPPRLHDQPARGVRRGGGRAARGGSTAARSPCSRSARPRPRSRSATRSPTAPTAACTS